MAQNTQYGPKILNMAPKYSIWRQNTQYGANSGREVPNSQRELTKISKRQPSYAERSKMAKIY